MKKSDYTESTALLSKTSTGNTQPINATTTNGTIKITQALPRLSDPVLKEVRKAERAKHVHKQQQRAQQQQDPRRRIRVIEVNPESHHIRTSSVNSTNKRTNTNKNCSSASFARDEYNLLEERLIASIQINEALENEINHNIAIAYQRQTLRVPMIAFMRFGTEVRFVRDFAKLCREEYDIVHTKNPTMISKKQLSLDMLHHENEYRTIVSVILYLESLNPPLTYVIARYPVTYTPKVPDLFIDEDDDQETIVTTTVTTSATSTTTTTTKRANHNSNNDKMIVSTPTPVPSFIERLYMNYARVTQSGYYYLIYVDLSLTTPEQF